MEENIHPLRIEEIKNTSIPFPLFYFEHGDPEFITHAIYISNVLGTNPLTMPQSLVVTRETGNGTVTTAVYQLVQATKSPIPVANSTEN